MISVHALAGGARSADYYLSPQRDDLGYYVNREELPGRWVGNGAQALGLSGGFASADGERLRNLLGGRDLTGSPLARPVNRSDGMGRSISIRREGFDVTLSAPKSVSALYALSDPAVGEQISAAHVAAQLPALQVLERLTARAARGHQGDGQRVMRIPTSGLIAAAFDHDTSRLGDPQLHTHVVIANMVEGVDGRWSALDSRTLYREATTASYLYHARLRAELTARLGVSWGPVRKGIAEIEGVPAEVREVFSKRRTQIEQALEASGRSGTAAAKVACLTTRPPKSHEPQAELRQRWAAEAAAAGFDTKAAARLLEHRSPAPVVDHDALAARVLAPGGVTRERSTFDRGGLVREICQQLPPGADLDTAAILALAGQMLHDPEVVPVVTGDGLAYSTVDMLATEQHALAAVTARQDEHLAVLDNTTNERAIEDGSLRDDQVAMVHTLTRSGFGVEIVTGPAGSGKTRALAAAVEAWTAQGIEVRGVAVAAITADGLAQATAAPSMSLARLMNNPARHIPAGGVLLLDEAGMVGTRQLARLIDQTKDMGCKLVLVGDPAQLPEMEAGGLFAALATNPAAIRLAGHHRQVEPWEAEALSAIRDGRTLEAVDAYADHGRLHTADTADAVRDQLVDDYLTRRAAATDPRDVLILARTKAQAERLNAAVRQRLITDRALGTVTMRGTTERGRIEFRQGDEVIITRNLYPEQLFNGTRATVTALGVDALTVATAEGRQVKIDRRLLGHGVLDHGYALTIHKAQGITVDHALVWADPGLYREAGYVALSRARETTHLYRAPGYDPDDAGCGLTQRSKRTVSDRGLAPSFDHSHRQHLALHHEPPERGYGRVSF